MSNRKFTTEQIAWGAQPKAEDDRFIPIYSPKPLSTLTLTVVCNELVSAQVHWLEKRHVPCIGAANGCEGCSRKRSIRVKGWLGCWEPNFNRLVLLEMTPEAMRQANVPLLEKPPLLRGMGVKAWRIGKSEQAPMRVELFRGIEGQELPPEFDVKTVLLRIWSGEGRRK